MGGPIISTSLLSLPAASLLASVLVTEAAPVTSGPGIEAREVAGGMAVPGMGGLGIETERPKQMEL